MSSEATAAQGARGAVQVIEPSALQLAHARRVAESKATVPHHYSEADVDATSVAEMIRAGAPDGAGIGAMLVRAGGLALRDCPGVNAAYRDARFELYSRINVGIAIEAQDSVLVPTIHDADAKDLATIAAEVRRLRERARGGEITQPELSGATFTLTEPPGRGLGRLAPIIRGGQAAALGAGDVVAGHLSLTLACDARILLAGEAAGFLARMRELLEHPDSL